MNDTINISTIKKAYFIGIGGIGMSAVARYFLSIGIQVYGYDKTPTNLTDALMQEGASIVFVDDPASCPLDVEVVVFTPAIPEASNILHFYRQHGKPILKRSDVLGIISKQTFNICIAGTHGKTTISTMIAHILRDAHYGCNAFLGGISSNYQTNFWSSENRCAVIEADEYDRSFLKLHPNIIAITAMDPDHLDIYGTSTEMEHAFLTFANTLRPNGWLITRKGLSKEQYFSSPHHYTYHLERKDADVYANEINTLDGFYQYNVTGPGWTLNHVKLNMGGMHNVENSLVAITIAKHLGIDDVKILSALENFKGVKRRFEYIIKSPTTIFIDDYAHHPEELQALISSAKALYPAMKLTVIFQPHLYSRTRDFAEGFAQSLSSADQAVLLPIYPARENPIPGISSKIIADCMKTNVALVGYENIEKYVKECRPELLITAGAGDIDACIVPLKNILLNQ